MIATFVAICFSLLAWWACTKRVLWVANICCNLLLLAYLVGLHRLGCCGLQFLAAICFSLLTLNQLRCFRLQRFVAISPCLSYGLDPIRVLRVAIFGCNMFLLAYLEPIEVL